MAVLLNYHRAFIHYLFLTRSAIFTSECG